MSTKRIQLALTVVAACASLTFFIARTYGANIVIGGNYTDIGTITFVSPKPGDLPTTVGTALLNTLNGIADNSATNPYLIKLGPGIYDLGVGSLQMKEYVDLEGSGENVTIITGHIDSDSSGVVRGANNAEIRFLTVKNTGGGSDAVSIYNTSASPTMTHVTVYASGGTTSHGVHNSSSSPTMTNVTVTVSGATYDQGVHNSSSSPTMTNVTVTVSGATSSCGVYNSSSSPSMTNVTATASRGTYAFGVFGSNDTSFVMTNVTATGKDGTNNYGLYLSGNSTALIDRSTFDGSTNSIYNPPGSTVTIGGSKLVNAAKGGSGAYNCVLVYKSIGGSLSEASATCN